MLQTVARLDKPSIWKIVWSPDRSKLAIVTWQKPVEIRDAVSLSLLETLGEDKKIIGFAFSPHEDVVAYCENGKDAFILHRKSQKRLRLETEAWQPHLTFSPDGKFLATGGYGTEVKLWSVADGELVRSFVLGLPEGGLTPVFSSDGKILAVGNRNAETTLFDIATAKIRAVLPERYTQDLKFDPSGKVLAVTYVNGSVRLWQASDGRMLFGYQSGAEELYTVDWSPDGSILATAGRNGPITLWNPTNLSVIREIQSPEWISSLRFSPDGLNLIFSGGKVGPGTGAQRQLEVLGIEKPSI